jgi:propionyl-CoA carboxylase alpha chain
VIARLLVANRGEIAARVLTTAKAMGMATVAVFADPDRDAPYLALADEAVPLGGAAPAESYLRAEAILEAAERTRADAVHPGYGFLAEDAAFAARCRDRGLIFVGPPPEVLSVLGDKLAAKRAAAAAGVPVLDGAEVAGSDGDAGLAAAARVGFPVMVKATRGGGGIGMQVVRDPADLAPAVAAARRQAAGAFGDDAVFLERCLEGARHVEVQVLADAGGRMAHLSERECSIQRRHQKLVEEAPSPAVGPDLRRRLGEAALAVARAVGYVGAGTVEFLLQGEAFWFLEVNARIQVEHPVTEAVTGLDLVRLQLLIAAGEPLPAEATEARLRGHAVEARLYAEDPTAGFLPQAGTLHRFRVGPGWVGPGGPGWVGAGGAGSAPGSGGWGVRVDAGVADGSVVGVHYDPLLAKVIAHAPTRAEAARLLAATLAGAHLHGVVTNRDLLVGLLRSPAFLAGETDTGFLDRHPPAALAAAAGGGLEVARLHAAAAALAAQATRRATAPVYRTIPSGWRNNPSQLQQVELTSRAGTHTVGYRFDRTGALAALEVDGHPLDEPHLWSCTPDLVDLQTAGVRHRFEVHQVEGTAHVDSPLGHSELREAVLAPAPGGRHPPAPPPGPPDVLDPPAPAAGARQPNPPVLGPPDREGSRTGTGESPAVHSPGAPRSLDTARLQDAPRSPEPAPSSPGSGAGPAGNGELASPLPGIVRRIAVRAGERVEAGTVVVVVEAMKTEHRIAAPRAGRVGRILVAEGQEVPAGAPLALLEEAGDG